MIFYGTRGDIQPGVALALELRSRGRDVVVAVPPNLVDFVRACGISAVAVGMDTGSVWDSPEAREVMASKNPLAKALFAGRTARAGFAAFDRDVIAASTDGPLADVDDLVAGPLCQERVVALAERASLPLTILRYGPFSPNSAVNALPGANSERSAHINRLSWELADRATWLATGKVENSFRSKVGLPPARGPLSSRLDSAGVLQIQAYDAALFPGLAEDWDSVRPGSRRPIVGFLDLPADVRDALGETDVDGALDRWLAAGEPPVFVTFGSMPISKPDEVVEMVLEAVRRTGVRALVSIRAAGRDNGVMQDNPAVYFAGSLDHASVLPRCAAAVHHGGAGTTAASLRAGLPTLIATVAADQAYWGARVRALGVGSSTRLSKLTADNLAEGIQLLQRRTIVDAAKTLAGRLVAPGDAVSAAANTLAAERNW